MRFNMLFSGHPFSGTLDIFSRYGSDNYYVIRRERDCAFIHYFYFVTGLQVSRPMNLSVDNERVRIITQMDETTGTVYISLSSDIIQRWIRILTKSRGWISNGLWFLSSEQRANIEHCRWSFDVIHRITTVLVRTSRRVFTLDYRFKGNNRRRKNRGRRANSWLQN